MNPAKAVSVPAVKASKSEVTLPPAQAGTKGPASPLPMCLKRGRISPQECGPLKRPKTLAVGGGAAVSQC